MDFQPALTTDVNIATGSNHQVLLAMGSRSDSTKGAKYLAGQGGRGAPTLPGKKNCAHCPPTQKRDTQRVCEGLNTPTLSRGGPRGVNAGLGCHNTGGIQRRGLQLLHRHIWPRLPKRLCVLLQRSTLPATVGLLVWK